MLKITTPLNKISFSLTTAIAFFLLVHHLFSYQFTHSSHLSPMLYPGLTILLMVLYFLIACFLFMRVICDSKRFYLVAIALGFMGSSFCMIGTLASYPAYFIDNIHTAENYNDVAIFFLFRHILLALMCCCTSLLYAFRQQVDNAQLKHIIVTLLGLATLTILLLAYFYSSYNPLLSLNLIDEHSLKWQALWDQKLGYLMIIIWLCTYALAIHVSQLKSLLWWSLAILCIGAASAIVILLTDSHTNSLAWFSSRIFEVISALIISLALLIDVFRLYRRSNQQYQISYHDSLHDPLSGLYNRRYLFSQLNDALNLASDKNPLSIIVGDIDHFKQINDSFGHVQGDKVIHYVSQIFLYFISSADIAARVGGEEFIIMLNNTDNNAAMAMAERIRAFIAQQDSETSQGALPGQVTISMGVYTVTNPHCTIEACMERADKAMYRAKQEGRNRVVNHH